MPQRHRTTTGKFQHRRADTHMGTIEKQYNLNLGVRADMHLSTYLERTGYPSLSKLLKGE